MCKCPFSLGILNFQHFTAVWNRIVKIQAFGCRDVKFLHFRKWKILCVLEWHLWVRKRILQSYKGASYELIDVLSCVMFAELIFCSNSYVWLEEFPALEISWLLRYKDPDWKKITFLRLRRVQPELVTSHREHSF